VRRRISRMMRTLKEEFTWLREWKSPAEFIDKLDAWVEHYNSGYLHSTLGYKAPMQQEREYHTRHSTQLAAF
jgi:transposase InsO family protein